MRILFVAIANSSHTARWISQLSGTGWNIYVFDMTERTVTPELSGVTAYTVFRPSNSISNVSRLHSVWPFTRGYHLLRRVLPPTIFNTLFPPRTNTLSRLIPRIKPDIIHSLEMQSETYPLLEVKQKLGSKFPKPWIYSSWGSDLYYYRNQPEDCKRIRSVLSQIDYYIADCQRDVDISRQFGFKGEVLGVFPGPGGFDINEMRKWASPGLTSNRRVIALKGYEGLFGRSLVGLRALQLCADALKGYTVEIFSANTGVDSVASFISRFENIPIKIIPPTQSKDIYQLMGRSRIAMGLSISDGSPNSMLEAMIMGALPIQSDTVSTREWIKHGENGLLVPAEDPEAVAAAIRLAISDNHLVDHAAEENLQLTRERIDISIVKPRVIELYEKVASRRYNKQP